METVILGEGCVCVRGRKKKRDTKREKAREKETEGERKKERQGQRRGKRVNIWRLYNLWRLYFSSGTEINSDKVSCIIKVWRQRWCVQFTCVRLFATPWAAAPKASLSITNSRSLLKLMCIASVMPSNHLIFCRSLLLPPSIFPSIRVFSGESVLCIRWPNTASTSVLPMNIQDWFPLGLTCWTSLQSTRL